MKMEGQWKDPVVEEVRERGRAYTARNENDVHRVFDDLREHQRENPDRYVAQVTVVPANLSDDPPRD